MKNFICLIICGMLLSVLQLNATEIVSKKDLSPINVVSYYATTQIVCPLNSTSFPSSIDVPIKVNGFNKIINSGGSISWDTSIIKYSYISNYGSSALGSISFNVSPAGYLSFNWNDSKLKGVTIPDSTLFFTVRFVITGSFGKNFWYYLIKQSCCIL